MKIKDWVCHDQDLSQPNIFLKVNKYQKWWPNNVPLYGYTTFYLFIHLLMDTWVACNFWLLWIRLLWGFPGDSLVKNPPASAGEVNAIPGLGGSHMPQGNWALAALGPGSHNPWAHVPHALACAPQEKPPNWGTWAPQLEQPPLTVTRESPGSSEDPAQPNKLKPKRLLWMWVDQCFCLSLCFQFFCV